jgi:thioredoxin 1
MSKVVRVTDANFETEVLKSPHPVLLDFSATWCGPCKQLEPIVEQVADEYAGRLKVGAVDIEESPEAAVRYGIMSVPTLVLIKDGQVNGQVTGSMPKVKLTDWIARTI